ncbi:hypothetical protein DPMN_052600 [Dreissena polymorpha]|uniref:Uncharacterized protein n=2 Tax=Dreissena polymorpha TaxID=45954 RepID=A0A9D4HPY7_DREPO|nr:hypothetical protein DPMN_052600 [Dreissena polymorpha]
MSAQLWTTTTVLTTSYLTTGTTELLTTSVSTISQIVTNILSTTLRLKRKTVVTGSLAPQTDPNSSAATGSEAVTQKANVYDSTSNPQNMIVPIG